MNNLIESIDTFKVNFGGEKHSIDAELFTKTTPTMHKM
jgi:hypothetical protein